MAVSGDGDTAVCGDNDGGADGATPLKSKSLQIKSNLNDAITVGSNHVRLTLCSYRVRECSVNTKAELHKLRHIEDDHKTPEAEREPTT